MRIGYFCYLPPWTPEGIISCNFFDSIIYGIAIAYKLHRRRRIQEKNYRCWKAMQESNGFETAYDVAGQMSMGLAEVLMRRYRLNIVLTCVFNYFFNRNEG